MTPAIHADTHGATPHWNLTTWGSLVETKPLWARTHPEGCEDAGKVGRDKKAYCLSEHADALLVVVVLLSCGKIPVLRLINQIWMSRDIRLGKGFSM